MSEVKNATVQRLQGLCKQRGLTLNALANLSGVTPSTVYSLLDDNRNHISIVTIKILCDGLDISLGEFFTHPLFDALEQELQ